MGWERQGANAVLDAYRPLSLLYGTLKLWRGDGPSGHDMGRNPVTRLMAIVGIEGTRRREHRTVTTVADPKAPRHPDLVKRAWDLPSARTSSGSPTWSATRRSEPCGGERTPPAARRSEPFEAEGSPSPEKGVRVDSSPDNDGTGQYYQMARVRLARRKGVREEPAAVRPSRDPAARTWWIRAA